LYEKLTLIGIKTKPGRYSKQCKSKFFIFFGGGGYSVASATKVKYLELQAQSYFKQKPR
jgi:hypothetical protein